MDMDILELAFKEPLFYAIGLSLITITFVVLLSRRDRSIELEQLGQYTKSNQQTLERLTSSETETKNLRAMVEQFRQELAKCKTESEENTAQEVAAVRNEMQAIVNTQASQISSLQAKVAKLEDSLKETSTALNKSQDELKNAQARERAALIAESYIKGRFDAQEKEIVRLHKLLAGFQKPTPPPPNGTDPKPPIVLHVKAEDETGGEDVDEKAA